MYGFGWILAIMGFTPAKEKFPRIAAVYVICFVVILLYQSAVARMGAGRVKP